MINKDTQIFGSFSANAGSFGTLIHNTAFQHYGINAIYKSFSIKSIKRALWAMDELNLPGAAVSAPFKEQVLKYVSEPTEEVKAIGAANTIINGGCGVFFAHNTDWLAAKEILSKYNFSRFYLLGNGGYAKAIQYAAAKLGKEVKSITRENWSKIGDLREELIFNATPVKDVSPHSSNIFVDCHVGTKSGTELALIQASYQFKLYTGLDFPTKIIKNLPEVQFLLK